MDQANRTQLIMRQLSALICFNEQQIPKVIGSLEALRILGAIISFWEKKEEQGNTRLGKVLCQIRLREQNFKQTENYLKMKKVGNYEDDVQIEKLIEDSTVGQILYQNSLKKPYIQSWWVYLLDITQYLVDNIGMINAKKPHIWVIDLVLEDEAALESLESILMHNESQKSMVLERWEKDEDYLKLQMRREEEKKLNWIEWAQRQERLNDDRPTLRYPLEIIEQLQKKKDDNMLDKDFDEMLDIKENPERIKDQHNQENEYQDFEQNQIERHQIIIQNRQPQLQEKKLYINGNPMKRLPQFPVNKPFIPDTSKRVSLYDQTLVGLKEYEKKSDL